MDEFTESTFQVVPSDKFSRNDTSRVSPTLNCLLEPLSLLETRRVPELLDSAEAGEEEEEGISLFVSPQSLRNIPVRRIRMQRKIL